VADPAAIYVFRWTPAPELNQPPRPQVWRVDLKRADGYFLAQQMALRDKDLVYLAPARVNAIAKVAQILGQFFAPVAVARSVAR